MESCLQASKLPESGTAEKMHKREESSGRGSICLSVMVHLGCQLGRTERHPEKEQSTLPVCFGAGASRDDWHVVSQLTLNATGVFPQAA